MFREVPLLKVGLILMALGLLIAAVVVSVPLRSDPERVVAAEVATNSPGEAKRYSSGQERSATKKSSSEKEKESLRYGSSSPSGGPVEQRKEETGEPQAAL